MSIPEELLNNYGLRNTAFRKKLLKLLYSIHHTLVLGDYKTIQIKAIIKKILII